MERVTKLQSHKDFSTLFSETWRTFRSSIGVITMLLFVFEVPSGIIINLGGYLHPHADGFAPEVIRTVVLLGALSIPFGILSITSMILLTAAWRNKERVQFQAVAVRSFQLFGRALATGLLMIVTILLWALCLIIPGIVFGVRYLFAMQATVLRDQTATSSLSYSSAVVKGRWWLVALTVVGFNIPSAVLGIFFPSLAASSLFFIILSAIITGYAGMFALIGTTMFFLDLDR